MNSIDPKLAAQIAFILANGPTKRTWTATKKKTTKRQRDRAAAFAPFTK